MYVYYEGETCGKEVLSEYSVFVKHINEEEHDNEEILPLSNDNYEYVIIDQYPPTVPGKY